MTGLRFIVTRRGREAIVNAEQNGTAPVLAHSLGLTAEVIEAHREMQSLPGEHTRLQSIKGGATARDTIHVTARDATDATYSVRGIGLYLADGTLLAVYGQPAVLAEKSTQAVLLLAADIQFADIAATDITFGDTNFDLNVGTEEKAGVLELATPTETATGTDATRAVHSKGLRELLDARFGPGAPTALAKRLIAAATESAVRQLLSLKGASLKDDGEGNGLDADLLDGKHGSHYLSWDNLTDVPASAYMPGQVITFAGKTAPSGTLVCDGRELLRTDYPRLFAAIGTTYGGNAEGTTFKLPKVDEDSGVIHTGDPAKVGQISAGSVISHTHSGSASGAGSHAHSAGADAVGDHAHGAWTDGQGHHGHTGGTSWTGDHQHLTAFAEAGIAYPWGADYGAHAGSRGNADYDNPWPYTSPAGGHSHSYSTDGAGQHSHNIGMNGAGSHSHTINIAAVGDHSHAITIGSTGSTRNLPAGIRMLFCIAF